MPPKPPFDLPESAGTRDPLTREALAWLVHLNSGDATERDWEAFQDWKEQGALHLEASNNAEALWERLGPALLQERGSKSRLLPVLLAAAIGLLGLAFGSGLIDAPSLLADYRTSTGEMRTVVLRDGSQVELDTGTSFDVDVSHRTITLHTGQIFASVKPDPGQPFRVIAANGSIRALGTAFTVRRDADTASIVVTEHAVRVTHGADGQERSVDVPTGQWVAYSAAGLGQPEKADVETLTAWRRGELVAHGRPLAEVVAEIARYRRGKIVVLGEAVKRLGVTGNFDLHDTNAFLESIQLALPVSVISMPGLVVIRARPG